jgi:SAM-dependent methyltransferase
MKESVMQAHAPRTYLPAAGRDWLLPLYDMMTKLMGADRARTVLLEQAQVMPGHGVLDVGCGTGSLTILVKRRNPRRRSRRRRSRSEGACPSKTQGRAGSNLNPPRPRIWG